MPDAFHIRFLDYIDKFTNWYPLLLTDWHLNEFLHSPVYLGISLLGTEEVLSVKPDGDWKAPGSCFQTLAIIDNSVIEVKAGSIDSVNGASAFCLLVELGSWGVQVFQRNDYFPVYVLRQDVLHQNSTVRDLRKMAHEFITSRMIRNLVNDIRNGISSDALYISSVKEIVSNLATEYASSIFQRMMLLDVAASFEELLTPESYQKACAILSSKGLFKEEELIGVLKDIMADFAGYLKKDETNPFLREEKQEIVGMFNNGILLPMRRALF